MLKLKSNQIEAMRTHQETLKEIWFQLESNQVKEDITHKKNKNRMEIWHQVESNPFKVKIRHQQIKQLKKYGFIYKSINSKEI